MRALAPTLQAFFTNRLAQQRQASPHTVAAYRDTFRRLFAFVHQHSGKAPSQVAIEDLDAPLIDAFLEHLEHSRGNSVRTRNARLPAVHLLSLRRLRSSRAGCSHSTRPRHSPEAFQPCTGLLPHPT